ncbi:single Ig IL-1-related receptor isoform X2 [Amia ocellicauda]|uniref:single Ig IL-1-related receptor isoform X2 n=1 Tax=Amia ocellicauda TaxID=2972642 RepID=UPI0034641A86
MPHPGLCAGESPAAWGRVRVWDLSRTPPSVRHLSRSPPPPPPPPPLLFLSRADGDTMRATLALATLATLLCARRADPEPGSGDACSRAPRFLSPAEPLVLRAAEGEQLTLNCTVQLAVHLGAGPCDSSLRWLKEGQPLNTSLYSTSVSEGFVPDSSEKWVSSLLNVSLRGPGDYGVFSCGVRNSSASFTLRRTGTVSHTAAVLAAFVLVLTLLLATVIYIKCRLNLKLWYKDSYGEYEMNDGKLFDAYVSYVNNENDRKFVNFILKPHLENRYSYKLHLNDGDILPGSEPSAELLMNVSRCRRLIVVLSEAYLQQEWCTSGFREGFWRLMELCKRPIFVVFESQYRQMSHPVLQLLKEQRHRVSLLLWNSRSMTPSSDFWKNLVLLMPRKLSYRHAMGDPQTLLTDDKDPMLTLNPDYLDCRPGPGPDPDPAGDLGVRLPAYKATPSRAPVLPAPAPAPPEVETRPTDIDISDLGSRSYAARTDFYCLVTEEDI